MREDRWVQAAPRTSLVGRAEEREAIAGVVRDLPAGPGGIVAIEGEPGLGKSRLLAHLADCAIADGVTVLGARASEFETDLPYALWTEALDRHLEEAGDRRLSRMGLADAEALSTLLPALTSLAAPVGGDRHRRHRALRNLLERLAAARPLVVWMDDVHWADPASLDAIAALVRRPPAAPVLLAVAAREGQLPDGLAVALAGAHREYRVIALRLTPLTEAEAAELIGEAAAEIYPHSGGNPFYLEQLARARDLPRLGAGARDASVPPAVAAALAAELATLSPDARRVLDAAAVAGDLFEPEMVAAVADLPEPVALHALDELLVRALVRPAATPRRFGFRHPVVRHAVYLATPPAWRLGAHARAADALERRGAGAVQRAHHVEHAARPGDEDAIGLLSSAATELHSPAPASAARFHAAALRLLPDHSAEHERRSRLQRLLADAQAAAGDPAAARRTLLDALRSAAPGERLALTVALANQEWWLGGHEDARRRLQVALAELPAQPSPDRIRLRLALALTALLACELDETCAHTSDARSDARAIGDPVFELAAMACGALASASAADGPDAGRRLEESAAALERLTAAQLATRLPALWMHGRARRALGQFDAALADLRRGAANAEQTGRERVLLLTTVESVAVLIGLGRLSEASTAAEEGVERARLAGNPRMLLWAQSALAWARLAAGDVSAALRHADHAAQPATQPDFHAAGEPGWCLGAALTAAGNPERAVPVLLEAFGGPELASVLPADRPAAAADLIDAQLALGDIAAAEAALALAQDSTACAGTTPAIAATGIARAAVLLARARPHDAVGAAVAARDAASGAPLLSARALLAEGQAHAAAGDRDASVEALTAAESAFARFGALRRRDEAARELRRLGHRVPRPARAADGNPLTAREREVAELVAAGRTNREIAEQLVLSTRTIEAHLRNIYGKLDVRSRVELTRSLGES
jgi:DNA-binding CsgD family transcriptional regulator/tetratricopeptide (TPR) repeat protein